MDFAPTQEQQDIRDVFASGETLVIEALAGTGKTSILRMLAQDAPKTSMVYVAFNRAIAEEARRTFPQNVVCSTLHSFAYRAVGSRFADRLNGPRVPAWQVVDVLRIPPLFEFGKFNLRDRQIARLVTETVSRFCHSASPEPTVGHVPRVPGMDTAQACDALSQFLLPFVERAWEDLQRSQGRLRFSHDIYLKIYSMGSPKLPGDVVLADEFQDSNGVTLSIIDTQAGRGARVVPVGDAQQQLYSFRGSINALDRFEAAHRLPLQKSFRFSQVIADRANLLLGVLGGALCLVGHDPVGSRLAHLTDPDVVLCRTNAEAVARLMEAQLAGVRAGLVGGTSAVENLAKAAQDLQEGRKTWYPDLMAFDNWKQVQDYAAETGNEARDLKVLVRLVDTYGPVVILQAVSRSVPEHEAHLAISTVHKAKGREFNSVKIASDFSDPRDDNEEWVPEEVRLQYVAVTRAKKFLDDSSLRWLEELASGDEVPVERLSAGEVPVRPALVVPPVMVSSAVEQVVCDPESTDMLVMHRTAYDPQLVDAQRRLPGRRYVANYCSMEKVNIVRATHGVLKVAERFGLSVSAEARTRVEELGLA